MVQQMLTLNLRIENIFKSPNHIVNADKHPKNKVLIFITTPLEHQDLASTIAKNKRKAKIIVILLFCIV